MKRRVLWATIITASGALLALSACEGTAPGLPTAEGDGPNNAVDWPNSGDNNTGPNNGGPNNGGPNNGGPNNGGGRELPAFEPAPATLHRLTATEYRATLRDLYDYEVTTALEPDTSLHGFTSVAASELTIPPVAVEQYEEVAWAVSAHLTNDRTMAQGWLGCDPAEATCLQSLILREGKRLWRRPLLGEEVASVLQVAQSVASQLRDPWQGVRAALATLLQAPDFLFRVDRGEPDPARAGGYRYTSWEMATRLSYFLWGSTPDDTLMAAAERGELVDDAGLRREALRLLEDPRAEASLSGFFAEFLGLERLDGVTKDAGMFPEYTPALRDAMRDEILYLFQDVAFGEPGRDFRELLTTHETFVNDDLAALYGMDPPGTGRDLVKRELPAGADRGGLIGRAALLALNSHATLNSPTLRGRFVRSRLLCVDIPPPPEGVIASLDRDDLPEDATLREKLSVHATDPACAGCHNLMDPLGYPQERFDPIGRWRELDNGRPIDATGDVDGVPIDGAMELGAAVAESDAFSDCVARRMYRYATGHLEQRSEERAIAAMTAAFISGAHRFEELVLALVMSQGFRTAERLPGSEETCGADGESRPCASACGQGVERCVDGQWGACDAPEPTAERCNGADDDCNGQVDDGLVRACDGECTQGTQSCAGGQWGECVTPPPAAETCNGVDDNCNGQVDEGLDVDIGGVAWSALAAAHEVCDGGRERIGPNCNAAIHRHCASRGCSATGFGPVESNDMAHIVCLGGDRAIVHETTYTVLAGIHPNCNASPERIGPNCNAAMHRFCANMGQTSGFGPLETFNDTAVVACTPGAVVINTTYTALSAQHGNCSAGGERSGPNCNAAIHRFCASQGHRTGFGPVENSGDVAVVTCIPQ